MKRKISIIQWHSRLLTILVSSLMLILSSCAEDSPADGGQQEENFLVSATLVYTASSQQIQLVAQLAGLDLNLEEFAMDVDIYKVTYNTEFKGANVVASGLVSFPKTIDEVPIISYQHGTITKDSDAPSNFSVTKPEALITGSLSSSGFVTVIPDYIGFGSSNSLLHPYFVEDVTASSVIDMLKAAQELALQKNITLNSKLFLAGYSEGGYATMATHKAIEKNEIEGLDLVASFPGAGAYDLQGLQQDLFLNETYDDPYYLAYIARAYQLTYDFSTILSDFFKEPYASLIPGLFDHQKGSGEINSQLTTVIADLVQPQLIAGLQTDSGYEYLRDAFEENTLTDWTPNKKMYMYHGLSDKTVPYQNSVSTYEALKANGASEDIISLTPLPGDHSSAVTPYVADFLVKLWGLR